MKTGAEFNGSERLAARSERLAIHKRNCQALEEAYARLRGMEPRKIRYDIDALVHGVTMERDLWEANFDPDQFLNRLPPALRRRYQLS
jgi:hypothetical protein